MKLQKNQEMKVYGKHACLALFNSRPEDVVRVYVTQEGLFHYRPLVRHCVDHKLAYHVVTKEELDSIAKATHHEGVLLVAKVKKLPSLKELFEAKGRQLILALEEVENPHNLGALMRTAAHFGASGIIYQAKVPVANSAAAMRTAEGGAEVLPALHIGNWNEVFELAQKNAFKVFATSSHKEGSLFETTFPEKVLLVLGAEGKGLSSKLMKKADQFLLVPGTGAVESLNVSNAAAAILSEWYRQGL